MTGYPRYSVKTLNSFVRKRRWARELDMNDTNPSPHHRVDQEGHSIYRP